MYVSERKIPCILILLQCNGICVRDTVCMCAIRFNPSIEITLLLSNLKYIIVDCNFVWKRKYKEISGINSSKKNAKLLTFHFEWNSMNFFQVFFFFSIALCLLLVVFCGHF